MIDFDTLFERIGRFFAIGEDIHDALSVTIPGGVDVAILELGAAQGAEYERIREGLRSGLVSFQGAGESAMGTLVQTPVQTVASLTVADDAPFASTVDLMLRELIRQMEAAAESLDANVPGASVVYDGGNAGDGIIMLSTKRADGRQAEFIYGEEIEAICSVSAGQASFALSGEPLLSGLSPLWPGGSGTSVSLSSRTAAAEDNLAGGGTFEDEEDDDANLPLGWLAPVATLGTTLKLTPVEVQTVVVSGTPTGGYYTLHWTNSDGQQQTTAPLAFDAVSGDVESALRALAGLESITVASTGTSPNFTHEITFVDVTNPAQLTSTSALTGGAPAINHATTTPGSANVLRGARALELDSNGAELTTIMREVVVEPLTQYAVWLFAKVDVVPAAGVLTVDLVDGVGGTVLNDAQGTANSFTFNAAALTASYVAQTGFFRTPATLPPVVFLRIRISTAVSAGTSVFLDEAAMVRADELYTDGLSASIVQGGDDWEPQDRAIITATNDRAGLMHEWLDRVFNLRQSRLLFPTSGAETISDARITN